MLMDSGWVYYDLNPSSTRALDGFVLRMPPGENGGTRERVTPSRNFIYPFQGGQNAPKEVGNATIATLAGRCGG